MSELCLQVPVKRVKNSVYSVWNEGTFLRNLFSQIQNWKDNTAPTIKGIIESLYKPRNHNFFCSLSGKSPNSGKHLVKNCACQARVVIQL
jgi:hypothetical protein